MIRQMKSTIPDRSLSYLHPIPANHHTHKYPRKYYHQMHIKQPLIEQYENQQSNIVLSSSSSNHISIDHHEKENNYFLYITPHRQICQIIKQIKSLVQNNQ